MSLITSFGLIVIICGIIFLFAGLIQYRFPPKKINSLYGYRTRSSMKSQERWEFAQQYSANQFIRIGLVLCASSLLGTWFPLTDIWGALLGLVTVIVAVVVLIIRVEKKINQKFELDDAE